MKVGDLVKVACSMDSSLRPLNGKVGVLVRQWEPGRPFWSKWFVAFGGEIHPYTINEDRLDLINEA